MLGRALRDTFDPVSFNFWRWFIALVVLTPFGLRAVAGKGEILRRHAGILVLLALLSVPLFQTMVYQGLRTTTAINAVLLNSSAPVFMIACSWLLERERVTRRQVAGMLISLAGIVIIMTRGEPARLLELELHGGDAWILAAMPLWGLYSVLLKRRPAELSGVGLLFVIALLGVTMLAPFFLGHSMLAPPAAPTVDAVVALLYVGIGASVIAFICWNRAVWRWSARTRRGSPCTCCRHSARCSPSPSCMRNSAASMPRASLLSSPGCCSPPTGDSL